MPIFFLILLIYTITTIWHLNNKEKASLSIFPIQDPCLALRAPPFSSDDMGLRYTLPNRRLSPFCNLKFSHKALIVFGEKQLDILASCMSMTNLPKFLIYCVFSFLTEKEVKD